MAGAVREKEAEAMAAAFGSAARSAQGADAHGAVIAICGRALACSRSQIQAAPSVCIGATLNGRRESAGFGGPNGRPPVSSAHDPLHASIPALRHATRDAWASKIGGC